MFILIVVLKKTLLVCFLSLLVFKIVFYKELKKKHLHKTKVKDKFFIL